MSEPDIDKILSYGEKLADEAEVFMLDYTDISLEQREMAVSSVFEHAGRSLFVRVVKDKHIGISGTSDIARWKDCVDAAVSSAGLSEQVPGWTGFPEKTALPKGSDPFDPAVTVSPDLAAEYLDRMNAGAAIHPEARIVTGGVSLSNGSATIANSGGVYYMRKMSGISLGMDAICDTSTGYEYDSSPFLDRINPEKIGEDTAYWAKSSRNGVDVETKKYAVVFSEHVVDSLILDLFTEAVNGKNVLSKKSVFAGKLGEEVVHPSVSICDFPMDPAGFAWKRFDSEGTVTHDLSIVQNGVLSAFLYDVKTASQANTLSTGHAHRAGNGATFIHPHCLKIDAPKADVMDKPCLYVREVIGAHTANSLTGEFSVEVANAFFAESGRFTRPVKKAMISGNIFDILRGGVSISAETKTFDGAIVPKMRIENMQVIG
ncbi:MAG: TldD/PmbA family protein [Methanocorpusculum sp.]|jgi:PmbA protein|nr:TldD/PmbA family protein [Methanocorpusculum sp.]MDD4423231.1 TldD/PmbA family protein [Methanocorpusculum parvum]MDD2803049.1 TldD/PmbA family protein [Methanocorpusculum sp.]MDD3912178.1 TldD/PmbA family protein [Methanocorpusculum sp.]MDY3202066.1 TldD/PmbA family protein [Methanocorpusculum sp.]